MELVSSIKDYYQLARAVVIGLTSGVITMVSIVKLLERVEMLRSKSELAKLKEAEWIEIGKVQHLYMYPVISCNEHEVNNIYVDNCTFQKNGITIAGKGNRALRDRMFVIYDEETECIPSRKDIPRIIKLKVEFVNKDTICLKEVAVNKYSIPMNNTFLVDISLNTLKNCYVVECKTWNEPTESLHYIQCIDCGNQAAEWISKFMRKEGLRLGYIINRKLRAWNDWGKYVTSDLKEETTKIQKQVMNISSPNLRQVSPVKYNEPPDFIMVTKQSLDEINKEALMYNWPGNMKQPFHFGANLIIDIDEAFSEYQYKYMKIGEEVIISNMYSWESPRLSLRSLPNMLVLRLMEINCKVIRKGQVQVNDKVYIRTPV